MNDYSTVIYNAKNCLSIGKIVYIYRVKDTAAEINDLEHEST